MGFRSVSSGKRAGRLLRKRFEGCTTRLNNPNVGHCSGESLGRLKIESGEPRNLSVDQRAGKPILVAEWSFIAITK